MAIPVFPFLLKFLVLKVLKGAAFGVVRFVRRVILKSKTDDLGSVRSADAQLKYAVDREWHRKENIVYLILMLSNAIYGAQELCVWVWQFIAKRLFDQYCAAVPAGFEMPEVFCERLHPLSKGEVFKACMKWIGMAGLFYWPKTHDKPELTLSDKPNWIEIRYGRMAYLVRLDKKRSLKYRNMFIDIDGSGGIEVKTDDGEKVEYGKYTQSD